MVNYSKYMFKAVTICFSLNIGGAGIAANRFKKLLENNATNIEVDSITQDAGGKFQLLKRLISFFLSKFQFDGNPIKHSLNLFSFNPVLNSFKKTKDIVYHLHWLNNDTLSIEYNKVLIKLMNTNFNQDSMFGKLKTQLGNVVKFDVVNTIEYVVV